MKQSIKNCYDSHVHFFATGQVDAGLNLRVLNSENSVCDLKIEPTHYRSDWLTGFGWDQHQWQNKNFPNKKILDETFKTTPVFFSRVDGHSSWMNSAAIEKLKGLGYNFHSDPAGGQIERDVRGEPTGILLDQAHINALLMLPAYSKAQTIQFVERAQKIFNRGGFTHVRDLSMTLDLWTLLKEQEALKKLTVCIDSFVTVESIADLPRVLAEIKAMQALPSPQLRVHGIKFFVDGSLGSKTAYLSQPYLKSNLRGLLIWPPEDIKAALKIIWQNQLDAAVHTIGDQAVHEVVLAARAVSASGILGRLHLEHVQIIRPDTLILMKPLHVTCHMQPCHWLSDHAWLNEVLASSLLPNLFPWEGLRKNKINFDFGSDSPIEAPSILRTFEALRLSAEKNIPALNMNGADLHRHPDGDWTRSHTEFTEQKIEQVYFDGEPLN